MVVGVPFWQNIPSTPAKAVESALITPAPVPVGAVTQGGLTFAKLLAVGGFGAAVGYLLKSGASPKQETSQQAAATVTQQPTQVVTPKQTTITISPQTSHQTTTTQTTTNTTTSINLSGSGITYYGAPIGSVSVIPQATLEQRVQPTQIASVPQTTITELAQALKAEQQQTVSESGLLPILLIGAGAIALIYFFRRKKKK